MIMMLPRTLLQMMMMLVTGLQMVMMNVCVMLPVLKTASAKQRKLSKLHIFIFSHNTETSFNDNCYLADLMILRKKYGT
jgi:hypothetical protein